MPRSHHHASQRDQPGLAGGGRRPAGTQLPTEEQFKTDMAAFQAMDFVEFVRTLSSKDELLPHYRQHLKDRLAEMHHDVYGESRYGTGPDAAERGETAKATRLANAGDITPQKHDFTTTRRLAEIEDLMATCTAAMLAAGRGPHKKQLQGAIEKYTESVWDEFTAIMRGDRVCVQRVAEGPALTEIEAAMAAEHGGPPPSVNLPHPSVLVVPRWAAARYQAEEDQAFNLQPPGLSARGNAGSAVEASPAYPGRTEELPTYGEATKECPPAGTAPTQSTPSRRPDYQADLGGHGSSTSSRGAPVAQLEDHERS